VSKGEEQAGRDYGQYNVPRGTRAFSDELSGSRSGGPLRESAGEKEKDREKRRKTEKESERSRGDIPSNDGPWRNGMRFWNFVLFVRPAWRTPRMISIDESRSRCCVPLRVLPRRQSRPDPVRPGAGIIFQPYAPRRRETRPSNPSKMSALKNLSTLRSAFPDDRVRYREVLDVARCCIIAASPLYKKATIFFSTIYTPHITRIIPVTTFQQ
ncbi:hypothetical protein ALC57_19036, partial [Trachymyrmex cornetzi]